MELTQLSLAHAEYLQDLTRSFVSRMKDQIGECLEKTTGGATQKELHDEVVQHGHFCVRKTRHFSGRVELLALIKSQALKHYDVAEKAEELAEKTQKGPEEVKEQAHNVLEEMRAGTEESDNRVEESGEEEEMVTMQKDAARGMGVTFAMEEEELSLEELHQRELRARDLMKHGKVNKPLVIHGPSGCGKTSLMAQIAFTCDSWFQREPVKVIRFLGTSPHSATIRDVLVSICEQIWEVYNISRPDIDIGRDFTFLTLYVQALLCKISTEDKPLVILLDSIDQLSDDDYAHSMDWLPILLPPNTYLILSMVPQTKSCLDNAMLLINDPDRFTEVPELPRETACDILSCWYDSIGRTLTCEQQDHILNSLRRCPQPMFLKLAFEQARAWKSYTPQDEWVIGHSVKTAIEHMFSNLERDHGQILVAKALGMLYHR